VSTKNTGFCRGGGGGVKCTLVQALRLCTGPTAHRGSKGIVLLFHDLGTKRGWGVRVTPWPLFNPGKDPVPIVQEAGWAPGPVWTGAENLASPGFDPRTVQPVASPRGFCIIFNLLFVFLTFQCKIFLWVATPRTLHVNFNNLPSALICLSLHYLF